MPIYSETVHPGGYVGPVRPAKDIRGIIYHMAESGPGRRVADYLEGKPLRNVSVQYTIELDGSIIRMVPELRVAGSLDPDALRKDTGPYYGRAHLDYVLGKSTAADKTPGPNHWLIAVEIAGKAADGPNAKQVAAGIRLFKDCRKRYPGIKPLGHRDQQNVKPCPGTSSAMKLMFAGMGGHGKDYRLVIKPPKPPDPVPDDLAKALAALAAAEARIEDLEDQNDDLTAAIASAIGTLSAAVPQEDEA